MTDLEMMSERIDRLAERVYKMERRLETEERPDRVELERTIEEWIGHFCGKTGDWSLMQLWKKYQLLLKGPR